MISVTRAPHFDEARISSVTVWNGGLGGLSDQQIQEMAAGLVKQAFPDYRSAFAAVSKADRPALAAALIAQGADATRVNAGMASANFGEWYGSTGGTVWKVLATASFAASAFHGYRRHNSWWGAIGWGFLGAVFPVLVPTVAVAQGFGKPKK